MPDYTVSGDVDSMLRSANDAAIRSAIGVGTTDAPTFLAQTLTGQSLTGTQATSLVDLNATWNTTGTPTALKLNVVETGAGSNAASKLMDLQVGGGSLFSVTKGGFATFTGTNYAIGRSGTHMIFGSSVSFLAALDSAFGTDYGGFKVASDGFFGWAGVASAINLATVKLYKDADGILAQRNGDNAQSFRVYDSYNTAGANFCRANLSFNSNRFELSISSLGTGSTTRGFDIGTNGTGDITFFTSGSNKWRIGGTSGNLLATSDNAFDIGASGANRPKNIYAGSSLFTGSGIGVGIYHPTFGGLAFQSSGVVTVYGGAGYTTFDRLQIGGVSDLFPAIARDGAGIKFTGAAAGSTSWIKVPAVAVSALPSASVAGVGARAFVNDALSPVFGSAVANGGSATVPVYSTGSAWNVG